MANEDLLEEALSKQAAKDFDGAETLYRRILRTRPTHLAALNNGAVVAKALGRPEVALVRLERAVHHHPQVPEAHFNLANTLADLERFGPAVEAYRRAIALRPNYPKAHLNLGNTLSKLRRWHEAIQCYRQALACGGADDWQPHANLAACLKTIGQPAEADAHLVRAIDLASGRADLHFMLGSSRLEMRDTEGSLPALRRALELDPKHDEARNFLLQHAETVCDWQTIEALSPLVRRSVDAALAAGSPCPEGALNSIMRDADPARNAAVAASAARPHVTRAPSLARQPRRRGQDARIRLGYLSGDFREHPVAQAVAGLLRHHDRSRFEIIAYSYGENDASPWRQRIIDASDRFVDLRWVAEDDAARQIHDDGTDVLIDLTLWTHGARPRIAALRPAPIQVQYLGFPGTSGAAYFDYAIVDPIVVPAEDRPHWTESLVLLPACYFVTDDEQKIGRTGMTRSQCALPENAVVYCSFNQSMKIDRATFALWMTILQGVPESVLWLPTLGPSARDNILREARRVDVDESRLIFAARTDTKEEHLERLGLADLALDTLRYNGHMTTSDALWAGIPVVTTLGRHFASRVSASMLRTMDLDDLVAPDSAGYVDLAIALGRDPDRRGHVRSRIATALGRASLFNTAAITRELERAFEAMFAQYRAGRRPAPITL